MLPKSSVMLGMAVAIMVVSRAERKMLNTKPMVIRINFIPPGYSIGGGEVVVGCDSFRVSS